MLWRSLLIRILVNFTAIFLTVLLMPGFKVIDPWLGSPVLDLLAAGLSQQQVLEELPDLVAEDISACLKFASSRLNHPILTA